MVERLYINLINTPLIKAHEEYMSWSAIPLKATARFDVVKKSSNEKSEENIALIGK